MLGWGGGGFLSRRVVSCGDIIIWSGLHVSIRPEKSRKMRFVYFGVRKYLPHCQFSPPVQDFSSHTSVPLYESVVCFWSLKLFRLQIA